MGELTTYRAPTPDPLALIARSGKAESTKAAYARALHPYIDDGGSLADVGSLAAYADTLGGARRRHLRSAVALWAKEIARQVKASVTPEMLDRAQATMMRLEALPDAIPVEPCGKGKKAHTWLSAKQVKALMATCEDNVVGLRDRVVLGLLVGAGLRRAELAALTWDTVKQQPVGDKMRTVLEVHGKGGRDRVVPISDRLAALLEQWANVVGRTGHIVRSLGRGKRLGDSLSAVGIFDIVRRRGAAIGCPTLAPHDCRRTYAHLGHQAGVPITQLSVLLGHSNVGVTQRYLDLDLDLEVTASDFVPM